MVAPPTATPAVREPLAEQRHPRLSPEVDTLSVPGLADVHQPAVHMRSAAAAAAAPKIETWARIIFCNIITSLVGSSSCSAHVNVAAAEAL